MFVARAIPVSAGLPVPLSSDALELRLLAPSISHSGCDGQQPVCKRCTNSESKCTWDPRSWENLVSDRLLKVARLSISLDWDNPRNMQFQIEGDIAEGTCWLDTVTEIGQPSSKSLDDGIACASWVAGTIIQAARFARQESLSVALVSSEQVTNGASAAIFKGTSELGVVALKVFGGIMSPEQQLTLLRELRNVRGLKHDHILPYIGSAVHGLRTILISPFMKNGDMLCYLKAHRDVGREQLILQVANAVEYLHVEEQLIHGDLKCENVLIADNGNALLTDFGLSTFIDNSQTTTTLTGMRMCNTLPFAAPELLLGEISQLTIDGRLRPRSKSTETDVYAFGMLIVQAFIENSPWTGLLPQQIIARAVSGLTHPRPGRDIDSAGMSDAWWDACCACWALKPSERPSIAQVANALQA